MKAVKIRRLLLFAETAGHVFVKILFPIGVILLSSTAALRANYIINDGFSTPLEALYFARYENLNLVQRVSSFIFSTVHNDSIKLFPSLVELIFFQINGFWSPTISILIGIVSWIICYLLIVNLIQKNTWLSKSDRNLFMPFIALCMFCPTYFFGRFTQVFVIHRTLLAICVLIVANILFNKKDPFSTNIRTIVISICCFIAQLSFANGFTLWLLILFVLALNNRYPKLKINQIRSKYYILACLATNTLYLSLFNAKHISRLASETMYKYSTIEGVSLGVKKFFSFLTNYISSFNSDFFISKPLSFSILVFVYILIIRKFILINNNGMKIERLVALSPFIFLSVFYSLPILARLLLRYEESSPRYFVEASIFSVSTLIIIYSLSKSIGEKRLSRFLFSYIFILSSLNITNIPRHAKHDYSFFNADQVEVINCIKSSTEVSYKDCLKDDSLWKIRKWYDLPKVFRVFNKNGGA